MANGMGVLSDYKFGHNHAETIETFEKQMHQRIFNKITW